MLHLKLPGRSGMGKLVLTYIDIFKNITDANPADVIVGLICMAVLLAVKIGVNERFKHKPVSYTHLTLPTTAEV